MISFVRPTKYSIRHLPCRTTSPVRSQPFSIAAAVASGSFQYSRVMFGPESSSSPDSPRGTSRPSSFTIRNFTGGITQPRHASPHSKGGVCVT